MRHKGKLGEGNIRRPKQAKNWDKVGENFGSRNDGAVLLGEILGH